jgi:hypothetical protein
VIFVGDQQVRRLDVAVDDAPRVCGLERHRNLHPEVDHLIDRQRTLFDSLLDRPASRSSITMKGRPSSSPSSWMVQMWGCLSAEAQDALRARSASARGVGVVFLAQELDRHFAIETEIFRAIDDTHAALAELVEHAIVGNDRLGHKYVWKAWLRVSSLPAWRA